MTEIDWKALEAARAKRDEANRAIEAYAIRAKRQLEAAEALAEACVALERARYAYCDTFPYDSKEGEAASDLANERCIKREDTLRIALAAYEAAKGEKA